MYKENEKMLSKLDLLAACIPACNIKYQKSEYPKYILVRQVYQSVLPSLPAILRKGNKTRPKEGFKEEEEKK